MAIGLDDFEFQLDNTGVTLNTTATIPYVDISRVAGLDNAPYRETMRDHEGVDGGFLDAEFEKGRDIILDGVIYADGSNVESYLDSIKRNYAPVTSPIPFYFKVPGVSERLIYVKPRGVRYNWEQARRLGITEAQFMLFAEDPRIYDSDGALLDVNYGGDTGVGLAFTQWLDTFTRSATSSWGTSDSAHTYTLTGTAAHFTVTGTLGRIQLTDAVNSVYSAAPNVTAAIQQEAYYQGVQLSATPTGGNITTFFDLRRVDANNLYRIEMIHTTGNAIQLDIVKIVTGTPTTLVSATTISGVGAATNMNLRLQVVGTSIRGKAWDASTAEPATWNVETTDTSITAAGVTLVSAVRNTGNTNTNPTISISQVEWFQGFAFDVGFGGGATPGGGTVVNAGNRPTPVTFVVTGPVTNPVITNNTTSHTIAFAIELSASDTLTINTRDRTVYLNGNINRRNTMTQSNWFFLEPGSNDIGYGGLTGVGSTLSIQFHSAWR